MKSGCIDFVDFVDKLVVRLTEGDQQILRTNHVTWLLAEIIRIELVVNALNSDSRKVGFELSIGFGSLFFSLFPVLFFWPYSLVSNQYILNRVTFAVGRELFHIMLSEHVLENREISLHDEFRTPFLNPLLIQ